MLPQPAQDVISRASAPVSAGSAVVSWLVEANAIASFVASVVAIISGVIAIVYYIRKHKQL